MPDAVIPQPILLLGAGGMLGRAWREMLEARGLDYTVAYRHQLDLTQPDTITQTVTDRISTVVNCAAWTDVDGAEANEADATAINGEGVGQLAQRCEQVGATLVHYSTDYVFNGQAQTPYRTDQVREPLNAYGRSKAVGEERIEQSGDNHLLIRTSWLYAPWGNNFVRTMARLMRERDVLRVVDDQRGRPSSSEHLARTSLALIEKNARGTYHVTDGEQCTWHEFACAIAQRINPRCQVTPCASAEFDRPAQRPAYSVLDLEQTQALLGPMPSWQDNLNQVLDRLE